MQKKIKKNTVIIAHGQKLDGKTYKNKLNTGNPHFIRIDSPASLAQYSPCILILDADLLSTAPFEIWQSVSADNIILAEEHLNVDSNLLVPTGFPTRETVKLLASACKQLISEASNRQSRDIIDSQHQRLTQLNEISIALSKETHLGTLLNKILNEAQNLSSCDAISLYLVDRSDISNPQLVFKLSQNDSLDFKMNEFQFPLNNQSIAGYVALNDEEVNIEDAYNLPTGTSYKFDSSFDKEKKYRTTSILAVPITNHDKEVIGVLQFINRKKDRSIILTTPEITAQTVIAFDEGVSQILAALASQAAIAIDNNLLLESIHHLFEGFVQASVTAIEQRDPTTSGHSFRVADLTTSLAEVLPRSNNSIYKNISYNHKDIREIRYASLLHDFGKVGVRENVLVKAKKLPESRLELLQYRFELEKERLRRKALEQELHLHHSKSPLETINSIHQQLRDELQQLDNYYQAICSANEPTVLDEGEFEHLKLLRNIHHSDFDGSKMPLISENDFMALSVKRGSLTDSERQEIQYHVTHTVNFLQKIPWTKDLSNVAKIASAHHERLNGQGYPFGLPAEEITTPSRMMAICDIYDALVANDRPYKKAIPLERALTIIESEAKQGLLDQDLVAIFFDAKIYELTINQDYRPGQDDTQFTPHKSICDVDVH